MLASRGLTVQDRYMSGIEQVLSLVEVRAAHECAAVGTLHAQRQELSTRAGAAEAEGNRSLAEDLATQMAALDIELRLAIGALAARNDEIARLRFAAV